MSSKIIYPSDSNGRRLARRGEPKIRSQRTQAQPRQVKKDVKTVLIFEPDQTSLEKLSVFLKKKGFRVLSTQRPEGVEFRFNNWPKPDLLIISAHKQLRVALKTFNAFSWNPYLAKCPVFLIGAGRHKEILATHAKVDHLRKIILTPFGTDLFVRVINELIRRARRS